MVFLRFVHINQMIPLRVPAVDENRVTKEIIKIFPNYEIDIRPPFKYDETTLKRSQIEDIKQPFEKQPKQVRNDTIATLYDGFILQKFSAEMIPNTEISLAHIHIIFTSLFTCTFSEDDWRYHGRTVICGTPSIISTTGIVEALAKPAEFYFAQLGQRATSDIVSLKEKFRGRFIDYDDEDKITEAAVNYALQAIFFFITGGEPFCNNKECRLFNAHWQEELIHTIEKRTLCKKHKIMASKLSSDGPNPRSS
jgi:hypothetical protein